MDIPGGGYYLGTSSGRGSRAGGGGYQNEQPAATPQVYFPSQDTQQCYQTPTQPGYVPFPNDPYFAWNQQNSLWLAQMQQSHPGSNYITPPPPPTTGGEGGGGLFSAHSLPSISPLQGRPTLTPPPPPPNLDAILEGLNEQANRDKEAYVRRLSASDRREGPIAPSSILNKVAPKKELMQHSPSTATAATPSVSSTQGPPSSTSTIPTLLDRLRAEVARREDQQKRTVPDLKAIEHATSILSSRTTKSPKGRREEDRKASRGTQERSDSYKENRGEEPTSRRQRTKTRRREGERERSSQSTTTSHGSRSTRGDGKTSASSSRRERGSRSERSDVHGERRRNGERRREEEWIEKPVTHEVQEEEDLQPTDIQLNVRERALAASGVQVYLHSDDEEDEREGESEVGNEEEEEGFADSDMDIETEADIACKMEGGSSSFCLQQLHHDCHNHSGDWGSGVAPEDEEELCHTPDQFAASGPSRRVNNPIYRESHKRARALASQSLSEEYRERYDLMSKHLRARCIFRGGEASCGPDAPKLTISDPRPASQHVQTFPTKESNVQYHGPDSFVAPSAYKMTAAVAASGPFTYFSRTKLVRAPVTSGSASSSTKGSFSLKRTIQNNGGAVAVSSKTTSSSATVSSTASSSLSSTASSASYSSTMPTTAETPSEGPTQAKLQKVQEMMAKLLTAPSSPSHASLVDADSSALRKTVSEATLDAIVASSEEASRPSSAFAHSPRADRTATATPLLPPRSALSFRKIGEHVVVPGSKLCFEWAKTGSCKGGVFCPFEHSKGGDLVEKKVCSRMLRGLCRGGSSCSLPHSLLPHQMPICEHYLRMKCNHGAEECGLVHIKHNEKVPVCVFFNQGKCTKEDDCNFRHQYRSDVVRSLGVHAPPLSTMTMTRLEQRDLRSTRLPKGRALLTAAVATTSPSTTRSSSATSSPPHAAAAEEEKEESDTSTFAWIM